MNTIQNFKYSLIDNISVYVLYKKEKDVPIIYDIFFNKEDAKTNFDKVIGHSYDFCTRVLAGKCNVGCFNDGKDHYLSYHLHKNADDDNEAFIDRYDNDKFDCIFEHYLLKKMPFNELCDKHLTCKYASLWKNYMVDLSVEIGKKLDFIFNIYKCSI